MGRLQAVPEVRSIRALEWFSIPCRRDISEASCGGAETAHQPCQSPLCAENLCDGGAAKRGVGIPPACPRTKLTNGRPAGGYQLPDWDSFKVELARSLDNFARMERPQARRANIYVHRRPGPGGGARPRCPGRSPLPYDWMPRWTCCALIDRDCERCCCWTFLT